MAKRIASVDALKALESKITNDVKHVNGILKILFLLQPIKNDKMIELPLHLAAIHSLRRLFTSLAQRGDLRKLKPLGYKRTKKSKNCDTGAESGAF